jgi:hypothetical protein
MNLIRISTKAEYISRTETNLDNMTDSLNDESLLREPTAVEYQLRKSLL